MKQYDEAERLFRRSLDIRERVLGADNVRTADSLYALGIVLRDTGRREQALVPLTRSFDIRTRELPKDDRDRIEVTRDYIKLLGELGRRAEAEAAQARADAVSAR